MNIDWGVVVVFGIGMTLGFCLGFVIADYFARKLFGPYQ